MKKLVYLFVSLFLVVVATENVNAQISDNTTVVTSATIIKALSISPVGAVVDLNFGNIVPSSSATSVTIDSDGNIDYGDAFAFPNNTGNPQAPTFAVSGEPDATFNISYPTSVTVTNTSDASKDMTVDIVSSPESNGLLNDSGLQTLKITATLNVDGNQSVGTYQNNSDFVITVTYN